VASLTWPVDLPQYFQFDSYEEAMADNLIRDNFDTGPAAARPRGTAQPYRVSGTMMMTTTEWETFKAFCANTLIERVLPFGFPVQGVCDETQWLVRIPEPPTRTARESDLWAVSFVLEVLHFDT
jgi:hypothetical protein